MSVCIQVFDFNGKLLRKFGGLESGSGLFNGIAVDGADNWLVCDSNNHRVQAFAADGSFITWFGSHGVRPGQFVLPTCVFVDQEGRVFVGDSMNRVQVFAFSYSA